MKTSDLQIGQKYGRLMLVAKEDLDGKHAKGTHQKWTFQCSCGTTTVTRPYFVAKGRTTSCGCYNREVISKPRLERRLEGGLAAAKQLWHSYKRGAQQRGYSFKLSFKQFLKLTKQRCRYCGSEPSNYTKSKTTYRDQYLHNGIDRVDNNIGYTSVNSVPCCKICNSAKKTLSLAEFEEWIDRLVVFRSKYLPQKGINHESF